MTLVLGGSRSGKSELAERLIAAAGEPVSYVATARLPEPGADTDFEARIAAHRARRPDGWTTIEVADDLPGVLTALDGAVLVDSLGTWVAGLAGFAADADALCRTLVERDGVIVLVSDEVGLGVVPATAAGGAYRDALGDVNRAVAAVADDVLLVVAGRCLRLDAP